MARLLSHQPACARRQSRLSAACREPTERLLSDSPTLRAITPDCLISVLHAAGPRVSASLGRPRTEPTRAVGVGIEYLQTLGRQVVLVDPVARCDDEPTNTHASISHQRLAVESIDKD